MANLTMAEKKADKRREYFIAIIPPPPYYDDALKLKHYFKDQYHSKASLKSPPHITLHMPFKWKENKENALITALEAFATHHSPFSLSLSNFGCFAPRVIFVAVKKSDELELLQKSLHRFCRQTLHLFNANHQDRPFHPHLTVAFRDLKKSSFHEAWGKFKEQKFSADFEVEQIVLLKHSGKIWEVFRQFKLV
jgi:2'-5' RNA ligase